MGRPSGLPLAVVPVIERCPDPLVPQALGGSGKCRSFGPDGPEHLANTRLERGHLDGFQLRVQLVIAVHDPGVPAE